LANKPRSSYHRTAANDDASYGGRHQAQLAWTLFVALAVGAAAFYQAISPKRAILTRESAESFRTTSTLAPDHSLSAQMGVLEPQLGGPGRSPASSSRD
jgi:hypothetical protein